MGSRFWRHHREWPHHPPWMPWEHDRGHHTWPYGLRHGRRFLFLRLLGAFGFLAVLVLGGMAVLAFLLSRLLGGDGRTAVLVWIGGVALMLLLPVLVVTWAVRAFRGIATPLADVMAAADAVAEGDLQARVPVRGHGEFSRLGESFNRMVERLDQADQQRRNLTADVAHELRTPLQIIQGNLEGILDGVYEPTPEHVAATLEETRLLLRLVEDLRTLSLAEAGQLPLQWESVDVVELLTDVATSFSGQAEAAGIDLRVEAGGGQAALKVEGDAGRLDQVLGNLVANALRYTPAGGAIVLQASPVPGGVEIAVRDTGQGIPAEELPYIFDRFWRGDRARSRAGGAGSGLGLAIARQLVQVQGGRIGVASESGQGTTFTVFLPGRDGPSQGPGGEGLSGGSR